MEKMMARICREGGARVRTNVYIRDMNVGSVDLNDNRHIEIIADGIPLYHGRQLAIDVTFVSPLSRDGQPRLGSEHNDGAALADAKRTKHNTYYDVVASNRCHLLVAGMETGGRCSTELLGFIRELAKVKAKTAPPILHKATAMALERRWKGLLAAASHRAYAQSLLQDVMGVSQCDGGDLPAWSTLL